MVSAPSIVELSGVVIPESRVTLEKRIAAGKYDWEDGCITEERLPLTLAAGFRQLILAHFNIELASPAVEAWAIENGYKLALIDDLPLALRALGTLISNRCVSICVLRRFFRIQQPTRIRVNILLAQLQHVVYYSR